MSNSIVARLNEIEERLNQLPGEVADAVLARLETVEAVEVLDDVEPAPDPKGKDK